MQNLILHSTSTTMARKLTQHSHYWFQVALLAINYALIVTGQGSDCNVTIQNGTIIGSITDTVNPSKKVCAFLGIPFASPPVGALRFKPPQPAQAWGSMNATKHPNWCPQISYATPPDIEISEDCLHLNVYQPQNAANENLPVMIWFHGGGFKSGSSEFYSPIRLLARGDVILVVVHYRLGLLGFLSTGDQVSPGNYGLKDQHFSIRWVHENIMAFGGNPEQINVFGESAGAASSLYQLISPLNKGLIHGVIAQSGSVLTAWALDPAPAAESAKVMAERLGCPTNSSLAIVDCISQLSWETIIEKQTEFADGRLHNMTYPYATLTPVVEPNLPGAFMSEHPLEILKSGEIDNVPVILGANKHDGSYHLATLYLSNIGRLGLDKDPEYMRDQLVPDILAKYFNIEGDEANRGAASSIELAYLSGVNRSSWEDSMPGLVDLMTVLQYKSCMQATAELLSGRGMNVYLYSFEHHSQNTLWPLYFEGREVPIEHGITHGDDLMYLFDIPVEFNAQDQVFSNTLCDLWINFASSGNPTPSWPVYEAGNESYMKLNATPTAMAGYRSSWRPNGYEWN